MTFFCDWVVCFSGEKPLYYGEGMQQKKGITAIVKRPKAAKAYY